MNALQRRLTTLEQTAWNRHKRQLLRDAFADVAREERWTSERLEREVQAALDEFDRVEPALRAMSRQGKTLREVLGWLAAAMGIDVDELLAEMERRDPISTGNRR